MIRTSPIVKITKTYKKIQVLCICFNSASCIYNTLKTWEPYTDRFMILLNGGFDNIYSQVEDTIAQLGLLTKPVIHFVQPFVNFSDCRNRLINAVYDPNYTIIMIDDSYELKTWKQPNTHITDQAIQIHTGNHKYFSNRIFNYQAVYENEIHEVVQAEKSIFCGIVVYDNISYQSHKLRRHQRLNKQIEILKDKRDARSKYYVACAYFNLYLSSLCTKEQLIESINERLLFNDTHTQEFITTRCFLNCI